MKCDRKALTAWSNRVKGDQDKFLKTLLGVKDLPPSWYWPETNAWRMEVLLWGGDDIALVVPAWTGWWTLAKFFRSIGGAQDTDPLTYAAGLVFCHHNAPIRRVRRLADDLAQRAKKVGRTANRCAYQVLESFDDLGLDPDTTADDLLKRAEIEGTDMVVDGTKMQAMLDEMPKLQKAIPRSKAYDIVRRILEGKEVKTVIEKTLGKAERDGDGIEKGIEQFGLKPPKEGVVDTHCKAAWLHLAELWDYLPEPQWKDPFCEGAENA